MANQFALEITKWKNATEKDLRNVLQATALKITERVIKRTPVDTGRARGNWQIGINHRPQSVLKKTDKRGGQTTKKASSSISRAKATDRISIINNLPYIEVLEMGRHNTSKGERGSLQAPLGMVRVTVAEFRRIFEAAVRKNR